MAERMVDTILHTENPVPSTTTENGTVIYICKDFFI